MHVLGTGLFTVVAVAKRLPVASVPEQKHIAVVRNNMIDVGRLDISSLFQALHTQWVCFEVMLSGFPPCAAVASAGCAGPVALVQDSVLSAVLRSIRNQLAAARMLARCVRSARHTSHLPKQTGLAEVSIAGHAVVIHACQLQELVDPVRSQVVPFPNASLDQFEALMAGSETIDVYGHRFWYTNRIGNLNLTLVSKPGMDQVPCDLPQHVSSAAVNLRGVFSGKRSAADSGNTTVGIAADLSASDTSVGKAAADHESVSRIDQLFEINVQMVILCRLDHQFLNQRSEISNLGVWAVLHRAQECCDSAGIVVVRHLGFGISLQDGRRICLQLLQELRRQNKRNTLPSKAIIIQRSHHADHRQYADTLQEGHNAL